MKKIRLTFEDTLNTIPVKNSLVKERKWDDGETFLVIPRKEARWVRFLSRVFYMPEEKRVYLDKIGKWVWTRCNGDMSVGNMAEELAREFKIKQDSARDSLLKYLKKLAEKRLIGFAIVQQEAVSKRSRAKGLRNLDVHV